MAEVEVEINNKVRLITKKKEELFEEETNIGVSLSEEEIKQYIDEVINEIKK